MATQNIEPGSRFMNLGRMKAKDRKLAYRAAKKYGIDGTFLDVTKDGGIGHILGDDGSLLVTRGDLRRLGKALRVATKAGKLGMIKGFNDLTVTDLYNTSIQNPNASYYQKGAEKSTTETNASPRFTGSVQYNNGNTYHYNFTGKDADKFHQLVTAGNYNIKNWGDNNYWELIGGDGNVFPEGSTEPYYDLTEDEFYTYLDGIWNGIRRNKPELNHENITDDQWTEILNALGSGEHSFIAPGLQFRKQGGTMKYQDGGKLKEFIKKIKQLIELKKSGVKEAAQQLEAMKQQYANTPGGEGVVNMINQLEQQSEQGTNAEAQYALLGAKLQYIQRLRNKCPEGFELKVYKAGGSICTKCIRKVFENKEGGNIYAEESNIIKQFKSRLK